MIDIQHLSLGYPGGIPALQDLCLQVSDGESVALIGANGAGKSTLLLALVGVLSGTGSITVDGLPVTKETLPQLRRRVGLVFQNPDDQLFMPLIYEDVAFGPRNYGLSAAAVDQRVEQALSQLGIAHLKERSSLRLSGGEKRMAAIATVLAMEPPVLLLDEPTAFLDPRARRKLIAQLNALSHTKLIATHDLDFARQTCSRGVFLRGGQVVAQGEIGALLADADALERCGI